MNSTGRYIVRYEPSGSDLEYLQTTIEMSISDEATIDDMANFFDSFLKAATYVYDGSLKIVKEEPKRKSYNTWEPVSSVTSFWNSTADTIVAAGPVNLGIYGAEEDVVTFGDESGVKP